MIWLKRISIVPVILALVVLPVLPGCGAMQAVADLEARNAQRWEQLDADLAARWNEANASTDAIRQEFLNGAISEADMIAAIEATNEARAREITNLRRQFAAEAEADAKETTAAIEALGAEFFSEANLTKMAVAFGNTAGTATTGIPLGDLALYLLGGGATTGAIAYKVGKAKGQVA